MLMTSFPFTAVDGVVAFDAWLRFARLPFDADVTSCESITVLMSAYNKLI
jgi:hypothetical protein